MVGTDVGNWITDQLGVVSGDVTSIICSVDKLSSFGANETSESNEMLFVKKVPPKNSGDHHSLVAVKIKKKETEKEAGFNNFLRYTRATKSASAQIYCIQPGNDAAHQELERLGLNFSNIESFYDITFVHPTIEFEDKKPQVWESKSSE
jgi:hypothetical protein